MRPNFLPVDETERCRNSCRAGSLGFPSDHLQCREGQRFGQEYLRKAAVLIVLPETSVFFDMVPYSHNTMCLFPEKILFSFHLILID